jgi:hypothetical protein
MAAEELRRRIKKRLERDREGTVEIYDLGADEGGGRLKVYFRRNHLGVTQRWRANITIDLDGEIAQCEEHLVSG